MKQFEIYWNDLTDEAKKRFKELYHDNIDMAPIAIVELEDDVELNEPNNIRYKYIIDRFYGFSPSIGFDCGYIKCKDCVFKTINTGCATAYKHIDIIGLKEHIQTIPNKTTLVWEDIEPYILNDKTLYKHNPINLKQDE